MSRLDTLQEHLCKTMRELYAEKILTDIGGNLSFRDPDNEEAIWVTPSRMQKNLVQPGHLVKLSLSGDILENKSGLEPSIESQIHLAIMREDVDVSGVIHSHAPYATSYSLLRDPPILPPLTAELTFLIPAIKVVPYVRSGTKELGEAVTSAIGECGIVILENHGVVACGDTIDQAAQRTRALEEYFRLFLTVKQFGGGIRSFSELEEFY